MKPKYFKNDEASATGLLFLCIGYLFVISVIIAFILNQGYAASSMIPVLPNQGDVIYPQSQNYVNCSEQFRHLQVQSTGGNWSCQDNYGYVLFASGDEPIIIGDVYFYAVTQYVQPDIQGKYTNSYQIDNSVGSDYSIVLRWTGSYDQNEVQITNEGACIPDRLPLTMLKTGCLYRYDYPNMNQIADVNITTVYDDTPDRLSVDFTFNGQKLFTTSQLHDDKNIFNAIGRYYAGVGAKKSGFIWSAFSTQNNIIQSPNSGTDISGILGLMATILKVLAWQIPDWVFPSVMGLPLITAILIGLPEGVGIACLLIIVIRGVS